MTDDLVKQSRDALVGVTDGPWYGDVKGFVGPASGDDDQTLEMTCYEVAECTYSDGARKANARFIAAARELVPAMADRIEADAKRIAELKRERDEARCEWQRCLDRANENYSRADSNAARVKVLEDVLRELSTARCLGNGEVLGMSLSDHPLGREILARMKFARAALEGEK